MFLIKKTIVRENANNTEVFMTNGYSAILKIKQENVATKLVNVMNENSDSNCTYKLVPIAK